MFKIDSNAPVPEAGTRKTKYPFPDMEVGDSFFVAGENDRCGAAANNWGRRHGRSFIRRATTEDGVAGFRVWRVS